MSRKLLAILAALLITASLCACGDKEEETTENTKIEIPTEKGTTDETDEGVQGSEIGTTNTEDPTDVDYAKLEYDEANDTVYIIHPNGAVKLHGDGDTKDTSLANGSELKRVAISKDKEWSKVIYEENTYYVYSKCLTTLEDLDEGFVECDKTVELKEEHSSLSVRNTPSMDNHVIGYVYNGSEIKVVAENTATGWYKVEYTPYGSEEIALGYIVSDAKWFKADESATTEAATQDTTEAETTEAATEADTEEATSAK